MRGIWRESIGRRTSSILRPRRFWSTKRRTSPCKKIERNPGANVTRGELYRVHKPGGDPKEHRTFVVASRQALIDSRFSTVVCAPVFSNGQGLSTQVAVGADEGLKHPSWIMCDNLVSLRKVDLRQYIGALSALKLAEFNQALRMALDL